ncbi:hypothetical protein [Streptomyces canus]|uniref:hypothetical protein n=1 Tax=Streptomyces canus TaxID=58343 RepID=UPI0027D82076|nr:hypothetical protein [Streptomyces canus]
MGSPPRGVSVAYSLPEAGCTSLSLGDTIGTGTPGHVLELLDMERGMGIAFEQIALHFRDTYGQPSPTSRQH